MRSARRSAFEVFDNPVLVGTVTILIIMVAVYLSYIAENGLPFVPTYNVKVQVADAAELVKNADVRVGGARVGQVLTITPEVGNKQYPHPYAELGLSLQKSLEPLPTNTKYQVRLASVLGGKYVELIPGTSKQGVPDGGTLTLTQNPATNHNIPFVDLDTAFRVFGPKTQAGIRSASAQLGDAVAGRGTDFNDAIHNTRLLIGPLENLLRLLAAPSTNISGFVTGLAATTGALAPVAPTVSALLANGATTFSALASSNLGGALDQIPPTESLATTVLTNAEPVLSDAATIVQDLKPGAALLPGTAMRLDALLRASPPVFKQLPAVASGLQSALAATKRLAVDPASTEVFTALGSNDLATTGASAFVGLGAILNAVAPAQFACNVAGEWVSNFASALSEGDGVSAWLRFSPLIDAGQLLQAAKPSPDLHMNYSPIEDSQQCQAGNEVYSGTQAIGNPATTSTYVTPTAPPAGVLALGRKVGLVP
ncbi:MAG TPA: MlaD family protein [Solirubrobacteraceae bacterium]|nr:MlaD family protein [Solirubrobacteraceae bacterium]